MEITGLLLALMWVIFFVIFLRDINSPIPLIFFKFLDLTNYGALIAHFLD